MIYIDIESKGHEPRVFTGTDESVRGVFRFTLLPISPNLSLTLGLVNDNFIILKLLQCFCLLVYLGHDRGNDHGTFYGRVRSKRRDI